MTTSTRKTVKQTAANNADLACVKAQCNTPIFREASELYNSGPLGRALAADYVGRMLFHEGCRSERIETLFPGITALVPNVRG